MRTLEIEFSEHKAVAEIHAKQLEEVVKFKEKVGPWFALLAFLAAAAGAAFTNGIVARVIAP